MIDVRIREMPGPPRRHHYVTKAYLEGFLEPDERLLFCYGRKRSEPFRAGPENLANIRDYYSFRRKDGTLDSTLEEQIGQKIESPGLPIVRMLSRGAKELSRSQRLSVARLIALQNVRVPYQRDFMDHQHKATLEGYIADMDAESRRRGFPVNALEVSINVTGREPRSNEWFVVTRDSVTAELRAIEADPGAFSREAFFELAEHTAKTISEMQWAVLRAPEKSPFITSDCPVVTRDKTGRRMFPGLKDQETEVLFPLSKSAVLRMDHFRLCQIHPRKKHVVRQKRVMKAPAQTIQEERASDELVLHLNQVVASRSQFWTFSGVDHPWLFQHMQATSSIPKLTRPRLESEAPSLNSKGRLVLTKKEFFVVTDE
jgi:hypothetical protein